MPPVLRDPGLTPSTPRRSEGASNGLYTNENVVSIFKIGQCDLGEGGILSCTLTRVEILQSQI